MKQSGPAQLTRLVFVLQLAACYILHFGPGRLYVPNSEDINESVSVAEKWSVSLCIKHMYSNTALNTHGPRQIMSISHIDFSQQSEGEWLSGTSTDSRLFPQQWNEGRRLLPVFMRSAWSSLAARNVCAGTWGCKGAGSSPAWWRSPSIRTIPWWWSRRLARAKSRRSEPERKNVSFIWQSMFFVRKPWQAKKQVFYPF